MSCRAGNGLALTGLEAAGGCLPAAKPPLQSPLADTAKPSAVQASREGCWEKLNVKDDVLFCVS